MPCCWIVGEFRPDGLRERTSIDSISAVFSRVATARAMYRAQRAGPDRALGTSLVVCWFVGLKNDDPARVATGIREAVHRTGIQKTVPRQQ